MNTNIVILDIETRPDENLEPIYFENIKPNSRLKDPAKIEADIAKKEEEAVKAMSVDHDFSKVFCVGIKPLGEEAQVLTFEEFCAWLYEEVPTGGNASVETTSPRWRVTKFITYNGKNFDWPVIIKYGIKTGAQLPYGHFMSFCDKYDRSGGHIDLMEKMGIVWNGAKSLDTYLQIYLGIKKKEIDFATCSDEELRAHCLEDIENTEKMFNLWNKHFSLVWGIYHYSLG